MMGPKDVTRKMLCGCGHTEKVMVPHAECIEAQLAQWEASIRLDSARILANEHRQILEDSNAAVEKAKQEVEKLTKKVAILERVSNGLKASNDQLREQLRLAKVEIGDLQITLQAERWQKFKHPVVAVE